MPNVAGHISPVITQVTFWWIGKVDGTLFERACLCFSYLRLCSKCSHPSCLTSSSSWELGAGSVNCRASFKGCVCRGLAQGDSKWCSGHRGSLEALAYVGWSSQSMKCVTLPASSHQSCPHRRSQTSHTSLGPGQAMGTNCWVHTASPEASSPNLCKAVRDQSEATCETCTGKNKRSLNCFNLA